MIIPDLNLLLQAYNPYTPLHNQARKWWETVANGKRLIGLPHEVLFGFIRISTNPALQDAAVSLFDSKNTVNSWLELPNTRILLPGPDHFLRVMNLMETTNSIGRILSNASLAAYAIENRATLFSNDSDFSRFKDLNWLNPLK